MSILPQVLPLYMGQSRRYRSLILFALFAALFLMGYNIIIVDKYDLVNSNFMGSTSTGGGSDMVTVTNKKEIINNQITSTIMNQKSDTTNKKKIINQITSTIMDQKSDTSYSIRAPHEVDDWGNDLVCSKPIKPIISDDDLGSNNARYINVGFPKSGSTSLYDVFRSAGISSSHYKNCRDIANPKKKAKCGICIKNVIDNNTGRNMFTECGDFTLWGEINFHRKNVNVCIYPQIQYLEKMYTDAPHATWIMPMRNVSDWIDSVTRWGAYPGKFRDDFGPCNFPQIGFNGSTDRMDDRKMMAMYCNHIVQIREFVKSHQTLSLIEFRIEDPNVGKFLESLIPIDADDWGNKNINNKGKKKNGNKGKKKKGKNSATVYRDIIHSDNDNVRELSSFTSAAEFDDACTRLPQLRVTVSSRYNKPFPGWPTHHFHASFQLHAIIYWAMVSQNLEEVCLYLPPVHATHYREYLKVLLPTFRFVLHPNRTLFNGSLTAKEKQPMSRTESWKKWIRNHPNGEPYSKFLQYLQTQNHRYECTDSDPEVVFLKRQSPDPKHRIEMGDPIHAIPKVEEIAMSMNASFGVFTGGEHDFITQARKFKCARVVIGQHGADMTNMMFAIHGRLQCIIEGPDILQQCFQVMASEMKADYHAVGAIKSTSQPGNEWDLDQLSKSTRACIRDYKSSETTTIIGVDDSDSYRRSTFEYPPFFIFGHSTGHSGSTTFHDTLGKSGCPWKPVSHFEDEYKDEFLREQNWPDDNKCELTNSKLIPHLLSRINRTVDDFDQDRLIRYQYRKERQQDDSMNMNSLDHTTYIDMGHFHNRGRILECLAKYFGESAAFVRIRRNRYDIARSFVGKDLKTPCIIDNKMYKSKQKKARPKGGDDVHPGVAICPRSGENSGPVNLKVTDDIWDSFVPFQRFLWYADEMEHRWHTITKIAYDEESYNTGDMEATQSRKQQGWGRPRFYDVTWNSGEELEKEVDKLRKQLGCTSLLKVAKKRSHVSHMKRNLNCSEQILQDLEYRKLMKYDSETLEILVSSKFPQHVDSKECEETRTQLEQAIQTFTVGITFDKSEWVLPAVDATFANYSVAPGRKRQLGLIK
jgi:hypothetical protein